MESAVRKAIVLPCEVVEGIPVVSDVSRESIEKRPHLVNLPFIQISMKQNKILKLLHPEISFKSVLCQVDEPVFVPQGWQPLSLPAASSLTHRKVSTPTPITVHRWATCLTPKVSSWTRTVASTLEHQLPFKASYTKFKIRGGGEGKWNQNED